MRGQCFIQENNKKAEEFRNNLNQVSTKPLFPLACFKLSQCPVLRKPIVSCATWRGGRGTIRTPSDKKAHFPQEEAGIHMS